jgi:RHS repeat-associated protein
VWDLENLLMEVSGGTQARYTTGLGTYGPVLSQRRGGTSHFLLADAIGTTTRLTDPSENVTDTYVMDAFGNPIATTGSTTNPFQYVGGLGYYHEADASLNYVRARWLRPTTGSWLSVDPVEGEARYQYVGGNPVNATDGSGRQGGAIDYYPDPDEPVVIPLEPVIPPSYPSPSPTPPPSGGYCWSMWSHCQSRAHEEYGDCLDDCGHPVRDVYVGALCLVSMVGTMGAVTPICAVIGAVLVGTNEVCAKSCKEVRDAHLSSCEVSYGVCAGDGHLSGQFPWPSQLPYR